MSDSTTTAATHPYLRALAERVLVYDGAMGTNIQRHHPTAGGLRREGARGVQRPPRPHAPRHHPVDPRVVPRGGLRRRRDVHLPVDAAPAARVGARGEDARAERRRRRGSRARRATSTRRPSEPRFVAGSIGPTGHAAVEQRSGALEHHLRGARARTTTTQAKYLVEGGVDVLLVETAQDILEVKAAIAGFERLFAELGRRVPVQAQVTLDTSGRMLLGTDIASAMTTLEALRVDVIGLNCSTGPGAHARADPLPARARDASRSRCIPNAGLPLNTGTGEAVYPLEPEPMAEMLARVRRGVRRAHRRRLLRHDARSISRRSSTAVARRRAPRRRCTRHRRATASRVSARRCARSTLRQEPPPLLVGERVNAQGSRKVKRLLLADDYEGIARRRARAGGLGRARARRLRRAHRARRRSRADVEGRQAALDDRRDAAHDRLDRGRRHRGARSSTIPGRAIINSINMENGRKRIDSVVPLAKKHGAALVALTIDPDRHGEDARAEARGARRRSTTSSSASTGSTAEDLIYDA